MTPELIGILAGMGPRSTAPFVDLLIGKCVELYGAKYDDDFPPLMIYSLPTPFFVERGMNHENAKATIVEGLRKLQDCGAALMAMPCNSAHVYFDELSVSVEVPLLNMVNETVVSLHDTSRRVGLLGAEMTVSSGMYQRQLLDRGFEVVREGRWQPQLNELIVAIKSFAPRRELERRWEDIKRVLKHQDVDTFIVACTDLNALELASGRGITIVDAGECLAQATVRRWRDIVGSTSPSADGSA
ncbi:MAG: aspartate/glutamate racemase family protein [Candidatus Zixiibacteriota bacterium]